MGFWYYHLSKLLSFCARSILFICKRGHIYFCKEYENQLTKVSSQPRARTGSSHCRQGNCHLSHQEVLFQEKYRVEPQSILNSPKPLFRVMSCQNWLRFGVLNIQAHCSGPGLDSSPGRTWGSEVGGEGEHSYGLRRQTSPNLSSYCSLVANVPSRSGKGILKRAPDCSCVLFLGFSEIHSWLSSWVTNCDQTWNSCLLQLSVSWSHKPYKAVAAF